MRNILNNTSEVRQLKEARNERIIAKHNYDKANWTKDKYANYDIYNVALKAWDDADEVVTILSKGLSQQARIVAGEV